jgi:hypothetical protein
MAIRRKRRGVVAILFIYSHLDILGVVGRNLL